MQSIQLNRYAVPRSETAKTKTKLKSLTRKVVYNPYTWVIVHFSTLVFIAKTFLNL